ncbi:MAG: NAD(P)/FAD-dependent oxidoreductase [Sulfitobacter sp.]
MKIVSCLPLATDDIGALQPTAVTMMPDLKGQDGQALAERLIEGQFDILITDCAPSGPALRRWSADRNREVFVLVLQTYGGAKCFVGRTGGAVQALFSRNDVSIAQALAAVERIYSHDVTARATIELVSDQVHHATPETALVVGAGIVGLITALTLAEAGYDVEVIEAALDPRQDPRWQTMGCTHGGANARMFSLTECDNYHDREVQPDQPLHNYLRQPISEMGWLIGHPENYTEEDESWIRQSMAMPIWLAEHYNQDIFALSHQSLEAWRALKVRHPHLFEDVNFCEPLLRVASTVEYNAKQLKRQMQVGSFLKQFEAEQIVDAYPSLVDGVENKEIAGAIEVSGFTVNIHNFSERLIGLLEKLGVRFRWQTQAKQINTKGGVVSGIETDTGSLCKDHYFISTGVNTDTLLKGTASDGKVHGVLGAWMTIPNLEPQLDVALKIARVGHIAGSGNIIPAQDSQGRPTLIFGSGFGYVGRDTDNIDPEQLEALYVSMEDYLSAMFPAAFDQALADGSLRQSRKYCVRPWTASSLGTFEVLPAESGLLVIASGHNTGGFSQSTTVAQATLDAFEGRHHSMHTLYHPNRYEAFWLDHTTTTPPPSVKSPSSPVKSSDALIFNS